MTTVRFSQVVAQSGAPETYLLLSRDDATFRNAVKAHRVMMVIDASGGAKTRYGLVGYDPKQRSRLLLFPRSLQKFEGAHVVGIKENLVADEREPAPPPAPKPASKPPRAAAVKKAREKSLARIWNPKPKPKLEPKPHRPAKEAKKTIPFPIQPGESETEDVERLKGLAARALGALKKGNSAAALSLLERIVGSD